MKPQNALEDLEQILKEWTSTPIGRRAFLASAGFLLASCATGGRHREREGDNTGQAAALSVEDEKRMTAEVMPEMRKDYPALNNPELQSYINTIGQRIVRANGLHGNPYNYNFTVVGVKQVNAFALPAGTVFVTAPLLAMAETEAELAGVVGHEIGHIKARHTAERIAVAQQEKGKSWMFAGGGGLLGGLAGLGLGKLLCPPEDKKCVMKAAGAGVAAGAAGGLLIQKYYFMANSREDEMEADRIGFRTSVAAGFHKDHVGSFYAKLLQMEEQRQQKNVPILGSLSDAMSTHPPSRDRVGQMQEMAAREPAKASAVVSSKEFERAKKIAADFSKG